MDVKTLYLSIKHSPLLHSYIPPLLRNNLSRRNRIMGLKRINQLSTILPHFREATINNYFPFKWIAVGYEVNRNSYAFDIFQQFNNQSSICNQQSPIQPCNHSPMRPFNPFSAYGFVGEVSVILIDVGYRIRTAGPGQVRLYYFVSILNVIKFIFTLVHK